jgi:hypothetical protein
LRSLPVIHVTIFFNFWLSISIWARGLTYYQQGSGGVKKISLTLQQPSDLIKLSIPSSFFGLCRSRNRSLVCAQGHRTGTPSFPLLDDFSDHDTSHDNNVVLPCFDAAGDDDDSMKCLDCKAALSLTCQAYRTTDSDNNHEDSDCMRQWRYPSLFLVGD